MKSISLGLIAIISTIAEMVFVQDATAFIFFAPLGCYLIAMGWKHGDIILTKEYWKEK